MTEHGLRRLVDVGGRYVPSSIRSIFVLRDVWEGILIRFLKRFGEMEKLREECG